MEIARHWRLKAQRYGLVGEVCPHCEVKIFPPRDVCPECGGEAKTSFAFSGKGAVYSYSTIYEAPSGFEEMAHHGCARQTGRRPGGDGPTDRSGRAAD